MHEVLTAMGPDATATTTIGSWNATTSVFRWVSTGDHGPMLIHADGELEELGRSVGARLGSRTLRPPFRVESRRLEPGQRLVLLSDGGLESLDQSGAPFGVAGLAAAVRASRGASAAATVHAIELAICTRMEDALEDDVTTVVLAPHTH
jgi:serine phosphatase RsbU (regulator of sigma subunit)